MQEMTGLFHGLQVNILGPKNKDANNHTSALLNLLRVKSEVIDWRFKLNIMNMLSFEAFLYNCLKCLAYLIKFGVPQFNYLCVEWKYCQAPANLSWDLFPFDPPTFPPSVRRPQYILMSNMYRLECLIWLNSSVWYDSWDCA